MNTAYKQPMDRLKRHMAEYQPQLKRAIEAIAILETANPDSDEFCNALAELHGRDRIRIGVSGDR